LETEVLFAFLLVGNVLDHTANSDEFASIFVVLWLAESAHPTGSTVLRRCQSESQVVRRSVSNEFVERGFDGRSVFRMEALYGSLSSGLGVLWQAKDTIRFLTPDVQFGIQYSFPPAEIHRFLYLLEEVSFALQFSNPLSTIGDITNNP